MQIVKKSKSESNICNTSAYTRMQAKSVILLSFIMKRYNVATSITTTHQHIHNANLQ